MNCHSNYSKRGLKWWLLVAVVKESVQGVMAETLQDLAMEVMEDLEVAIMIPR
jgi:hypothetical protein